MRTIRLAILLILVALITGCGYNAIQSKDEAVNAAWTNRTMSPSSVPKVMRRFKLRHSYLTSLSTVALVPLRKGKHSTLWFSFSITHWGLRSANWHSNELLRSAECQLY